ncbi:MAG: DnaD domain protein [Mycobacterium leprae]
MAREPESMGELSFLAGLLKRGFVNIPRIIFDLSADLGLDYADMGKLFAVMACFGGPAENPFGPYHISRGTNPGDFDQVRTLVLELEQKELVLTKNQSDEEITFSFGPLLYRLRAYWEEKRALHEAEARARAEAAAGRMVDPAVEAAERLLARPLSSGEVKDIQDWVDSFGFSVDLVQAVIEEGKRSQGNPRMAYLNQIARQWHQDGITTPQGAEEAAERRRQWTGKHKVFLGLLGLNRPITVPEHQLMDKWSEEWGFSNEVIIRALEASSGVAKPLHYANKILESWRTQDVRTVADAERAQAEHKRSQQPAEGGRSSNRRSSAPSNSNVFLKRDGKKDRAYDDYHYDKPGE